MATQGALTLTLACLLLILILSTVKPVVSRVLLARRGEAAAKVGAQVMKTLTVLLTLSLICAAVLVAGPDTSGL